MQFNDIVSSFLYQHDHRRPPQVCATRPSSTVSVRCSGSDKDTGGVSSGSVGLAPGFSIETGTQLISN